MVLLMQQTYCNSWLFFYLISQNHSLILFQPGAAFTGITPAFTKSDNYTSISAKEAVRYACKFVFKYLMASSVLNIDYNNR